MTGARAANCRELGEREAHRSPFGALLSLVRGKLPMTVSAERLAINKRTLERDRELPQPAFVRALELHASLRASLERHWEGG